MLIYEILTKKPKVKGDFIMQFKRILSAALCGAMLASGMPSAIADTDDDALGKAIDAKTEALLKFEGDFNDEKGNNTPAVAGTSPTFTAGQSGQGTLFVTNSGYLNFSKYRI